jgi:hypothetical protein
VQTVVKETDTELSAEQALSKGQLSMMARGQHLHRVPLSQWKSSQVDYAKDSNLD